MCEKTKKKKIGNIKTKHRRKKTPGAVGLEQVRSFGGCVGLRCLTESGEDREEVCTQQLRGDTE
jgi:hypothetical protein